MQGTFGIVGIYHARFQDGFTLKGSAFQYVHGQFQHLVAMRRINKCGQERSVFHGLDAVAGGGQRINAHYLHALYAHFLCGLVCPDAHSGALRKHQIGSSHVFKHAFGLAFGLLCKPIGVGVGHHLYFRIVCQSLTKTTVAFNCGRRTAKSLQLHYAPFSAKMFANKASHGSSDGHIVGPDKGRVLV